MVAQLKEYIENNGGTILTGTAATEITMSDLSPWDFRPRQARSLEKQQWRNLRANEYS